MKILFGIFAGIGTLFASLFGVHNTQLFGAYNPTGGGTYRLQSSIGTTDASITLTSFKEPVSNLNYTMSYLNTTIEYATIDPQTNTKEFISFSGITQNSDGSATLTGVIRGLSFSYPYTASSTFQQAHSAQGILILSNPPQLTNNYANKSNTETITGQWTYTSGANPAYDTAPGTYASNDLVAYQTLLNTSISGAATSTETNMGIAQIATQAQVAAGTASSTQGRPLYIESKFATTTYNPPTAANRIPVTGAGGTISAQFIATSTGNDYNWAGLHTFTATSTFASTTVASSTVTTLNVGTLNAATINGGSWSQCISTTTTAAMAVATTTVSSAVQDIVIDYFNPTALSSPDQYRIFFNGDSGNNYGTAAQTLGGSQSSFIQNSSGAISLTNGGTSTTSPVFITINIKSTSANRKLVTWAASLSDTGSRAPSITNGAGVWNNTSAAITSIEIGSFLGGLAGTNVPAGVIIRGYCSNN